MSPVVCYKICGTERQFVITAQVPTCVATPQLHVEKNGVTSLQIKAGQRIVTAKSALGEKKDGSYHFAH